MAKINWASALTKYITDQSVSYQDISNEFGVSKTAVNNRATKENWQKLRAETLSKLEQNLTKKVADEITEAVIQHIEIGKLLVARGLTAIQDKSLNPDSWDKAKEAIKDGITIQRKAMRLDEQPPIQQAVQIVFTDENLKDKSLLNTYQEWSK